MCGFIGSWILAWDGQWVFSNEAVVLYGFLFIKVSFELERWSLFDSVKGEVRHVWG